MYHCCEQRHCHARHDDEPHQQRELGAGHAQGQCPEYQIYVDKTEGGTARIEFVCGPDQTEIADTTALPGTGLGSSDASLDFTTSAAGLHYVKITTTSVGSKTVRVADLSNDEATIFMAVGASATGTFGTPTDRDFVTVPMVNGTTYQIDVRSVGYPGIDPWIIDIYDQVGRITRPAGMFGASYAGFFDHDSGPRQRGAGHLHRDQDRRPLHRVRQPRRSESATGRLAPASDRGVCPVLRRLRGGRFHQRHRGCGRRLCVGPD